MRPGIVIGLAFLIAAGGFTVIAVTSINETLNEVEAPDAKTEWEQRVTIITDPETKCEYVLANRPGGLTPRLDGDGRQIGCH